MDLTPALRFGDELVVCYPAASTFIDITAVIPPIREKLSSYSPNDSILAVGDPVLIALAALIAGEFSDSVSMLKWDRKSRKYIRITIDLLSINPEKGNIK